MFCVDQEHAARMRQALINENADLVAENHRYVMRITGNDTEGQDQLGNFIDPESKYPVLVTTSRLLSTGVDAQTCRLIVLDREVGSMTEFKQIVGRGTRVHEDTRKFYFTLIDFRGATSHFADPDFDGEPVQIYEPGDRRPVTPPDDAAPDDDGEDLPPEPGRDETIVDGPPDISIPPGGEKKTKIYVDGVGATIIAERVEYLDENGKLVTESLRDFTKKALRRSASPASTTSSSAGRRRIASRRSSRNWRPRVCRSIRSPRNWARTSIRSTSSATSPSTSKPLTRRERADNVKKRDVFAQIRRPGPRGARRAARQVRRRGHPQSRRRQRAADRAVHRTGNPVQLIRAFGGTHGFERAVHELQSALYQEAA